VLRTTQCDSSILSLSYLETFFSCAQVPIRKLETLRLGGSRPEYPATTGPEYPVGWNIQSLLGRIIRHGRCIKKPKDRGELLTRAVSLPRPPFLSLSRRLPPPITMAFSFAGFHWHSVSSSLGSSSSKLHLKWMRVSLTFPNPSWLFCVRFICAISWS
jgi:hypothetical protein